MGDVSNKNWLWISIGLLILIGSASAIDVNPSKFSVKADGMDEIGITVSGLPAEQVKVHFQIMPTSTGNGTFSKNDITSSGSNVVTYFKGTTSGDVIIDTRVNFLNGTLLENKSITVHVLSGDAYRISRVIYQQEVEVNSTTSIAVRIVDKFNNGIENEIISFSVSSPENQAKLIGTNPTKTNSTGYAVIDLMAGTRAGDNIVWINPSNPALSDYWIDIVGIGSRIPYYIYQECDRSGDPYPLIPADGYSRVTITYKLEDFWHNPSPYSELKIRTSPPGESATLKTNNAGVAQLIYGPKKTLGLVNITATSSYNTDTTCWMIVEFASNDPATIFLGASPENMPSLDVNNASSSEIRARLIDKSGNPIKNEKINFSIKNISTGIFTLSEGPKFSNGGQSIEAITGVDGYARVTFTPGRFVDRTDPRYYSNATASCVVKAEWTNETGYTISGETQVVWKNYAYLRAEVRADKTVLSPQDPYLDVTIQLIGDGPELTEPMPADIVLLLDRGEDMLIDDERNKDKPDRMEVARDAAMKFVNSRPAGKDQIALITYGDKSTDPPYPGKRVNLLTLPSNYNWQSEVGEKGGSDDATYIAQHYPGNNITIYDDYATKFNSFDLDVENWDHINTSLYMQMPMKSESTGQASAPIRYGLYSGIKELKQNATRSEAVKAIVLLMQNTYRYYGNPIPISTDPILKVPPDDNTIAKGTNEYYPFADPIVTHQNMAEWAKQNNIKIFVIYYNYAQAAPDEKVPRTLAEVTGGDWWIANNATELDSAFENASKALDVYAGINTSMNLNLVSPITNTTNLSWTSTEGLLDYVPLTWYQHYNWTENASVPSYYLYKPENFKTYDHSSEWDSTQTITFTEEQIGTIKIKETWWTKFRLKLRSDIVNDTIQFNLFGPGSEVRFNATEAKPIIVPDLSITYIPNMSVDPLIDPDILVWGLNKTAPPSEYLNVTWNITYRGTSNHIDEFMYIRLDDGFWRHYTTITNNSATAGNWTEHYAIDLRTLPRSHQIGVRINATAPGAGSSEVTNQFDLTQGKNFIKIE
ncbi:MAG: hypothetical protein QMD46_13710 [Methanomicrobiales archaeon]|nr:hypothetical protein [Methanomicrobiales archaeon]MDI6877645.1 hypothetical protein [Methanomicrobiales archaeon]